MDQPNWLLPAWLEFGQREIAGRADNPRIMAMFRDAGHPGVDHDEAAWCAGFVGACLHRAGQARSGSLMARSYLNWGTPLDLGRLGAIAVFRRGGNPVLGHVGFLVGEAAGHVFVLGGNQGNAVTVARIAKTELLGLRWPSATGGQTAKPESNQDQSSPDVFDAAIAHVLKMEGGYSNDPHDPGGPTNRGITLAAFASWRGVALTEGSRPGLIAELKRIPVATAKAIYRRRYWEAARCDRLSAAGAVMHFDAAVNHGVGSAARMLQQACGADVDGEIGPNTLAAVSAIDPRELVQRYADVRRQRYRSLAHFWRFGRGWLARVDATLRLIEEINGRFPQIKEPPSRNPTTGDNNMTSSTPSPNTAKWWGSSLTIWGAFISAVATVLPAIGPVFGLDITGDLIRETGDQFVTTMQAITGLIGTLMTIWGRMRAKQPLTRRPVQLRL